MTTLQIIMVGGFLLTIGFAIWIRGVNKRFASYSAYDPDLDEPPQIESAQQQKRNRSPHPLQSRRRRLVMHGHHVAERKSPFRLNE